MAELSDIAKVVQSSSLVQRLNQRHTEPVGVVDVRPFQSQYARIPGWLVQRTALLNQLQNRYSTQNSSTPEGSDLVLAVPGQQLPETLPLGEQGRGGGNQTPVIPPGSPMRSVAFPSGTSQPSVSAGVFRVSRKAVPLVSGNRQESGGNSLSVQSDRPTTPETMARSPETPDATADRDNVSIGGVSSVPTQPARTTREFGATTDKLPLPVVRTVAPETVARAPESPGIPAQKPETPDATADRDNVSIEGVPSVPTQPAGTTREFGATTGELPLPVVRTVASETVARAPESPGIPAQKPETHKATAYGDDVSLEGVPSVPTQPAGTTREFGTTTGGLPLRIARNIYAAPYTTPERTARSPELPPPSALPASSDALPLQATSESSSPATTSAQPGDFAASIYDSVPVVQQIAASPITGDTAESLILPKRNSSPAADPIVPAVTGVETSGATALAHSITSAAVLRTGTLSPASPGGGNQPLILRQGIPVSPARFQELPGRSSETPFVPVPSPQQGDHEASPQENRLATTPELSSNLSPLLQTQMVWRKFAGPTFLPNSFTAAGTEHNSLPLFKGAATSNGQGITHQTDSNSRIMLAEGGTGGSGPGNAIAPPAEPQSQRINIAQIAEQVSRILARRLTVERERRGINQW